MDWRYLVFLSTCLCLWLSVHAQSTTNLPPTWLLDSVNVFVQGISEDTPVGTTIATLKCTDPENDRITYKLKAGKAVRVLNNGDVILADKLDFEQKDTFAYDLTFTCVDVDGFGYPRHSDVEYRTQISVNDANDNPPKFSVDSPDGYSFNISEDAPLGTVLKPQIKTIDLDRTVNARLSDLYIICNSKKPSETANLTESSRATCEKFTLTYRQEAEGIYVADISLKGPLDYETRPVYSSKLVAIDGPGLAVQFTTTVNIQINIVDAQDVDPIFTNPKASTQVSEGALPGTTLNFAISARDGDSGARRPVRLSLVNDPKNAFSLAPSVLAVEREGIYSSQLIVKTPLDREEVIDAYNFVVKVTELENGVDTLATATATYSVFVTDVNDNPPTFSQQVYNINVTEMEENEDSLQITGLHIQCRDPDEPSNAQYDVRVVEQSYDVLKSPKAFSAYSVSPKASFIGSASLFLKVENSAFLDFDTPEYRFQRVVLEAKETGPNAKFSSSTTISIFLQDINDNAPVFAQSEYNYQVLENVKPPYNIGNINATDKDSGVNGRVEYRMEGGSDVLTTFRIDKDTGVLTMIAPIDYEDVSEYVFLVYATDKAVEPKFSQAQVTVEVLNYNDIPPRFLLPEYQASVSESSLFFVNPVTVHAVDEEDDGNGVTYRIKSGQSPNRAFNIHPSTGVISLRNFLDYDQTPFDDEGKRSGVFTLEIEASDNGNPPLLATVFVFVRIIDENNHGPVLNQTTYNARISELAKPGTVVAQVYATDQDSGDFGKVTYRIGQGQSDNFIVHAELGIVAVSNSSAFDFNVQAQMILLVIASDGGAPQKSATATVNIEILDANNKDPYFNSLLFLTEVDEKTSVNTTVLTAKAEDKDSTANLEYKIDESTIRATDSSGKELISIFPYNYMNAFGVNQNGGIYIKNRLDKSYVQEITFTLKVIDKNTEAGAGYGTTQVTLIITGDPDSRISFDPIKQVFMNEDSAVGYTPITVTARDPNNNAVSDYRIDSALSSPHFRINAVSGQITLSTPIDYEQDTMADHLHKVVVQAFTTDKKESASVTVTISIVDVNDNSPVFQRQLYEAQVSENARYPTEVLTIFATDDDSKSYGPLEYRISGGLDSDDFTIFHEAVPSGSITSRRAQVLVARGKTLDFNKRREYNLDIIVGDNRDQLFSNVRLYSTAKLIIRVIDENNYAPTFKEQSRSIAVPESAPIGQSIATIIATDEDYGKNGMITYSLEAGDDLNGVIGLSYFSIVPNLGTINVARSLLGMGNKVYPMRVKARDGGDIPNSNYANIEIKVLSTEDDDGNPKWLRPANGFIVYAPEEEPGYMLKVENSSRFFDVIPRTGTSITYSLSQYGPFAKSFQINSMTGEITIIDSLDREVQETYTLLVYAEDKNGTKVLRTGRQLIVKLVDKDDNSPTFPRPRNYTNCHEEVLQKVSIKENTAIGTTIFTLRARDLDSSLYNGIYYELFNGSTYCAKQNEMSRVRLERDGRLVINSPIDYEQDKEYKMCVAAKAVVPRTRKKRAFDCTQVDTQLDHVAYVYITILDENDNGPKFPSPKANAVLPTEPETGPVFVLNAVDADGPGNNNMMYRIESSIFYPPNRGSPVPLAGAFTTRGDRGALYPSLPSYKEFSGGRFEVTVSAADSANPSLSDKQEISIYVYEQSQALKVILDLQPSLVFRNASQLVTELDAVDETHVFSYLRVSEHVSKGGDHDPDLTDVCFLVVDKNSGIFTIRQLIDLLAQPAYKTILQDKKYRQIDSGSCYPATSSEDNIKWRNLWWVLVAIGIFLGVCCIILAVLAAILHHRYQQYMKTRKSYMVS